MMRVLFLTFMVVVELMNPIRHLRTTQLDPTLTLQLAPFVNAHRPHDEVPTKEQLGNPLDVREETTIEEIQRLRRNRTYHKQQYIKQQNTIAYQTLSELYYNQ